MKQTKNIVIAGNPNSGKTTLFNKLTGTRQHVANYPGVTVERKEGSFIHNGCQVNITDLPGTYSLSSSSPDEFVAVRVLLEEKPDLVVNIIDSSNLERNLFLTIQLLELGLPVLLVLNMTDTALRKGIEINAQSLSSLLGVPVVKTVASKGQGLDCLKNAIAQDYEQKEIKISALSYSDPNVRQAVEKITSRLPKEVIKREWTALKLLEGDKHILDIEGVHDNEQLTQEVSNQQNLISSKTGHSAAIAISGQRYALAQNLTQECRTKQDTMEKASLTDSIDALLTSRLFGIPIFMFVMYMVFKLTFAMADPLVGYVEMFFEFIGNSIAAVWAEGTLPLLRSLVLDGIIAGVGGVLVFVPNIMLLFLAIAVLEDSGYMPRAAFIMDKLMNKLGLNGKSFIPLLVGFGCTVPAIMATRTIESKRDRLTTMLVAPLMSCGARLPIYALLIPAFFPSAWHARVLWLIYMSGIVLAVICAKLLHLTVLKGEHEPFLMELPPYRFPTPGGITLSMWQRSALYIKKAGTIILGISILLWVASTFPEKKEFSTDYDTQISAVETNSELSKSEKDEQLEIIENERASESLEYTISGRIGKTVAPIIKPLGFDWKIGTALIAALAAKEVFVAQMGIVYSVGEADEESQALRQILKKNYSPLQGLCIMLFCLISTPCIATTAVMRRESNSWFWALFQLFALTALAYIVTLIIFQLGTFFEFLI